MFIAALLAVTGLAQGRVGSAGMIFFDPQGTEVGGLTFRTEIRPDGTYTASRSLTFDQHQQDQVVGLQYSDNGKTRGQGLSVWDRPTSITLKEIMSTVQGPPDRAAVEKRFSELARSGSNGRPAPYGHRWSRASSDCRRRLERGTHGISGRSWQGRLIASAMSDPLHV
jgi:hypothetical protein